MENRNQIAVKILSRSLVVAIAMVGCARGTEKAASDTAASGPQVTSTAATGTAAVTGARIAVAHAGPAGEWQMPAGDYASSRYSELSSISPQNDAKLRVARAVSTRG